MSIKKFSINPDILKIVALIAMTIDHFYKIVLPESPFFFVGTHIVGRIAMPLFSGLMMYHLATKQIFKKYLYRLSFFGVLSILLFLPFQYADHTAAYPLNILCTLAWGVLAICLLELIHKDKTVMPFIRYVCCALCVLIFLPFTFLMDYDIKGFGFLLCFYFYFINPNRYSLLPLLCFAFYLNDFGVEGLCSLLATLLIVNIDFNKSYPRLIKHWYTFYIYYPLHRVLFFLIAYLMMS